jgi:hypothetical protein
MSFDSIKVYKNYLYIVFFKRHFSSFYQTGVKTQELHVFLFQFRKDIWF